MEPYRFRACSPMMQAFKNKYWYSKDIKVVLPPGSIGSKVEIAHCVLVLGGLIDADEHSVRGGRAVLLQDVYGDGADKMVLTDDVQRAYNYYKDKTFAWTWLEWLLLSLYYPDTLDFDQSRLLARDAAIMDLKFTGEEVDWLNEQRRLNEIGDYLDELDRSRAAEAAAGAAAEAGAAGAGTGAAAEAGAAEAAAAGGAGERE